MVLGHHWSFNLRQDPKRLAFVLARYRFAAEMTVQCRSILELGCSEGIGAPMLARDKSSYTGVDLDEDAIETARDNWPANRLRFLAGDFLGQSYGRFDAAISLDVIEHIAPDGEYRFFQTVTDNLKDHGIAVIGTPNKTADGYASPMSKAGHINLFDGRRLITTMKRWFHHAFLFGMNDELVHTGFTPMAHYLVCVGCNPKR